MVKLKDVKSVILEKMDERGVPLYKLAEKTGLTYRSVFDMLSAQQKRRIRAEEFLVICIVLQLSLNDFIDAETGK